MSFISNFFRRSRPLNQTSKQRGDELENRVVRIFRLRGRFPVRKSVILRDSHGNISEIDVIAGTFFKTYVECKNYSGSVPLEAVAKFKEVLSLNGVPHRQGLFVTTSTYVPRARTIGIRTLDGSELRRFEAASFRVGLLRWLFRLTFVGLPLALFVREFIDTTSPPLRQVSSTQLSVPPIVDQQWRRANLAFDRLVRNCRAQISDARRRFDQLIQGDGNKKGR